MSIIEDEQLLRRIIREELQSVLNEMLEHFMGLLAAWREEDE